MANQECAEEIRDAIQKDNPDHKLSPKENLTIRRNAMNLKSRIEASGDPSKVLENFMQERAEEKAARQMVQASKIAAKARANARLESSGGFASFAPGQVLQSIFVSSLKQFKGAFDSLGVAIQRAKDQRGGAFLADLDSAGLLRTAMRGKDQENIWKAYAALDAGGDPSQFGSNAAAIAKILKMHIDRMMGAKRAANMPVGHIDNWYGPQQHDPYAIARAGGNPYGSTASLQKATEDYFARTNWERSFGGEFAALDDAAKKRRLTSVLEAFVAGKHLEYGGASALEKRDIFFNNVQDAYANNQQYGGGRSLAENVHGWLQRSARDIEIWNRAGSNPESWVRDIGNEWGKQIAANEDMTSPERVKARAALDNAVKSAIRHWIPSLTDSLGHPEHAVARWVYNANALINSLAVGAATPVLVGDVPLMFNQLSRFAGERGRSYFSTVGNAVKTFTSDKAHIVQAAAAAEIMLQDLTRPMSFANADRFVDRNVNRINSTIMKAAGHTDWTDRIRTSTATAFGAIHWFEREHGWSELEPEMQRGFERFGIGEKEWDAIRAQDGQQVLSNVQAFGPAAIRSMELDKFKALAGEGASDAVLRRARNDVADKYRNFIGEMADRVTTSPSEELRALITLGTRPGSLTGMMVRMFNGLKSFTYNLTRNHYGAVIAGDANPRNVGLATQLYNFARGTGGEMNARVRMAKFVANNVAFGALIHQLSLVRNGQQPIVPDTPGSAGELLWKGFLRQGAGMYGDLLFSTLGDTQHSTAQNIVDAFAPIISDADDMADAVKKIGVATAANHFGAQDFASIERHQKAIDSGLGQVAKVGYGMIPGTNFVWSKWATDFYLKDGMMDAINPGYKQRLMARAQKNGTPYLLGPQQ